MRRQGDKFSAIGAQKSRGTGRRDGRRICVASLCVSGFVSPLSRADTVATWLGGTGDWTNSALWSTQPNYPNNGTPAGAGYSAVIDGPGPLPYTVAINSGITVNGIILNSTNATLSNSSSLTVNGTIDLKAGNLSLSAQINNARIQSEGGTISLVQGGNLIFNNVQLAAPLTVPQSDVLKLLGELKLDGADITMVSGLSGGSYYGSHLGGIGTSVSITGAGSITFTGGNYSSVGMELSGPLILGPGITVNSGTSGGTLGDEVGYTNGSFTNQGTINVTDGRLTIRSGSIRNQGVINVSGGELFLSGKLVTSDLGTIHRTGGIITLAGKLDNTGQTLDLNRTGAIQLENGNIDGGTILGSGTAALNVFANVAANSLSNLSLGANVSVSGSVAFANVTLIPGGAINLPGGTNLDLSGLGGQGTIWLNGQPETSGYTSIITGSLPAGLALITGSHVANYGGYAGFSGANNGLILTQTSGQMIRLTGAWSNPTGTIRATGGGIIAVASSPVSFGNFSVQGATFDVETTLTTAQLRTINATATTFSVGFSGTLDNTNDTYSITADNPLFLAGGVLMGGTVVGTAGSQLTMSPRGYIQQVATSVPINIPAGANLFPTGLTLSNTTIYMNGGNLSTNQYNTTAIKGSILGAGTILFEGSSQNQLVGPFVVAPGITVQTDTGGGFINNVTNQGSIRAITSGQTITFSGAVNNDGLIEAGFGGRIVLSGVNNWTNSGTISLLNNGTITAGTFNLGGSGAFNQAGGTFSAGNVNNGGAYTLSAGQATFQALSGTGSTTIDGAGALLSVSSLRQGTVTVNTGGSLILRPSTPRVTNDAITTLKLNGVATLDLSNHSLSVDALATPLATVQAYVINARNGGTNGLWTGPGLTSSFVAGDQKHFAIAIASGTSGVNAINSPLSGRILVRPALIGDANLNGIADNGDFSQIIARGHYLDGTTNKGWVDGDFNLDGQVDNGDISILLASGNYLSGTTFSQSSFSGGPEGRPLSTPTKLASSAPVTLVGVTGDGIPDFQYDPQTGDVKFRRDGLNAANVVGEVHIRSVSGQLDPNQLPDPIIGSNGLDVTRPTEIDLFRLSVTGKFTEFADNYDLGPILQPNRSAANLLTDLTLTYTIKGVSPDNLPATLTGVPEPKVFALTGLGVAGLLSRRRRALSHHPKGYSNVTQP